MICLHHSDRSIKTDFLLIFPTSFRGVIRIFRLRCGLFRWGRAVIVNYTRSHASSIQGTNMLIVQGE